jgi:hypothetical protein
MKQYRFNLDEEQYGYVYFEAESLTEAESLLEQVREGDLMPEDLPNGRVNIKNGQCNYDNLEEVTD